MGSSLCSAYCKLIYIVRLLQGVETQGRSGVVPELAELFRELSGIGASRRAVGLTVDGPHGTLGRIPASISDLGADLLVGRLPIGSWGDVSSDLWTKTREG